VKGASVNQRLTDYVDGVFAPYEGVRSIEELKGDLLVDLQDRFRELRAEGYDDATAFEMTVDSIGDIEQTVQEVSNLTRSLERQTVTRFDASSLRGSDFAGVVVRNGKFAASVLRGSDFSRADLTGSSFTGSDVAEANFDSANLTDVKLTAIELARASFRGSILVRTDLSMSGLSGTRFVDAVLTDVKLQKTDLRRTVFENCTFTGVDFSYSDLRGLHFDGAALTGVRFDGAALHDVTFRDATLRDVSFRSWGRKYRSALRSVVFEGARIDKLTYAGLKGMGANLSGVTVE
jgi:uncharacterized protein YjbI with pentapeptide repeats